MATHVKILGWLHILFGLFGVFIAVAIMGGSMLGGMFAGSVKAMIGVGVIGTFVAFMVAALAIPGLIAGYGLLKLHPWARILTIVIAIFELIHFPFGTILGVYSLWVLLSAEGSVLFKERQVAAF